MREPTKAESPRPEPAFLKREAAAAAVAAPGNRDLCGRIGEAVNEYTRRLCSGKANRLRHCGEEEARCPCASETERPRCVEAPLPNLEPCISISWGESVCDCMETDDVEVLCITVCNCYSNVTFRGLTIGYLWVTDAAGNQVPALPDGTPSVEIIPLGPICFGDIGPCRDGRGTCVTRQVVLRTRGARGGDYRIDVGAVCFSVSHDFIISDCFRFQLCPD